MPLWSEVARSALPETLRIDAEYYRPDYLEYARICSAGDPLADLTRTIIHPVEVVREYTEAGIQILLAQNIRHNYLDLSHEAFMPRDCMAMLARNRLVPGDVVMTRSGANFGDAACYLGQPKEIYACADCLIIRPSGIEPGYLSTFLNTAIGRALLTRGAYGAAQPHIAPPYVRSLRIPRLGKKEEREVQAAVLRAEELRKESTRLYEEAEAILCRSLKLDTLKPSRSLFYERPYADVATARRADAEYFNPRYQRLLVNLSAHRTRLSGVATLQKERFDSSGGGTFEYIEIGEVSGGGTANSVTLRRSEAPSRAQWIVRQGDIITSMVRPIRRLSALIQPEQDGFVCSSGFVVLRPDGVDSEVLLVYLRFPLICELLDLYTSASMYPAVSTEHLLALPAPLRHIRTGPAIAQKVRRSLRVGREARRLLDEVTRQVEDAVMGGT